MPLDTALEALLPEIHARRAEFAAQACLSQDIVEKLRGVGVYRALVPRNMGGDELGPADFCKLVERISQADGSTGWVASFGVSVKYLAALPLETLQRIYADGPDVVFAGAVFPPQAAQARGDGIHVAGRWKFGSGCTAASLVGVGITWIPDPVPGLPRMAVLPRDQVRIEHNWDVIGMQGSGSHDVIVDAAVVRPEWTCIRGGAPALASPLYRYPSLAFAAQVLAVVGLGVARAALDEITAAADGRVSITGAPNLADRAYVQIELAKAEAQLRFGTRLFYESTESVWQAVLAGEAIDAQQAKLLRLASTNAARAGADVARAAFTLAGTPGIFRAAPMQRYLYDALVVAQHALLAEGHWQSAGRVLLGQSMPPGYP
ncbi:acyl-CoA dehydrogenase family protein [Xanthomonas hyacinthi]|uniref:acyl-CoA dehydrogenase family protein n=1 Tax=Xanthomonas hyacinthi TaxID=56455 RepID=UPI000A46811C|nr:acyl-CoA dehydrogenase family protein [Xanthomonas hyacinthi]